MKPFLPWPGSKAKCSKDIISEFPKSFRVYHEPFLGSGSIFFALSDVGRTFDFEEARLSDVNRNLIKCFGAVMDKPGHVAGMLLHCLERNTEEFYNSMRSQLENPSVFLYVMRAAFSSMYRENTAGEFNVPWRKQDFGVKKRVISFNLERLYLCSRWLIEKKASLFVADWLNTIQDIKAGDLVYFDPPYIPYTETGFINYVSGGFAEGNHNMLSTQCRLLAERGVFVVLSNSDTPGSRRIYGEPTKLINVSNSVKSTAKKKGTRAEALWIFAPKRAA